MKGSFTGAMDSKTRHFEYASGGTVFLDENRGMAVSLTGKAAQGFGGHTISASAPR